MSEVYVVRVAETEDNVKKLWSGRCTDSPLTTAGVHAADQIADLLARAGVNGVFSSPARRTIESAQPLAQRLRSAVEVVQEFQELDLGDFDGASWDEAASTEAGKRFLQDPTGMSLPGACESIALSQWKAVDKVRELVAEAACGAVAIYTHGGIMRAMLLGLLGHGDNLAGLWGFRAGNSCVAHLEQKAARFELVDLANFGGLFLSAAGK